MLANQAKSLKERVEELIDLEPHNFIRRRLIFGNSIGDLGLDVKDKIKILEKEKRKIRCVTDYLKKKIKVYVRSSFKEK